MNEVAVKLLRGDLKQEAITNPFQSYGEILILEDITRESATLAIICYCYSELFLDFTFPPL